MTILSQSGDLHDDNVYVVLTFKVTCLRKGASSDTPSGILLRTTLSYVNASQTNTLLVGSLLSSLGILRVSNGKLLESKVLYNESGSEIGVRMYDFMLHTYNRIFT